MKENQLDIDQIVSIAQTKAYFQGVLDTIMIHTPEKTAQIERAARTMLDTISEDLALARIQGFAV